MSKPRAGEPSVRYRDAAEIAEDEVVRKTVCIIGGGAVGIAMARELIDRPGAPGVDVVVLESGTRTDFKIPNELRQSIYFAIKSLRTTLPPFITNFTCCSSVMSSIGLPKTATAATWSAISGGIGEGVKPKTGMSTVIRSITPAPWELPPSTILVLRQFAAMCWT